MKVQFNTSFTTIKTAGAMLPADLLERVFRRDKDLPGLKEEDFHLVGEKINEATNRSWNRLLAAWKTFQEELRLQPEGDRTTSLTREKWLLPLFDCLGYGRLQKNTAISIEGKSYPVSHMWNHTPIHLVGSRVEIDKAAKGVTGAARIPHSMLQEFLNRSDEHLWAFLSNGMTLRILRDNISLTRQSYVEFDLYAMMEGEQYSDFILLWMLCHQSRVEAENQAECILELWSRASQESGVRAGEKLREGVHDAIEAIGRGFLKCRTNQKLHEALKEGQLNKQEFYRQILRIVYRFIFLTVAEDRNLLHAPDSDIKARETYKKFYSIERLRRLAAKRRGSRHIDLWQSFKVVCSLFEKGNHALAIPGLGSFLWSKQATASLNDFDIGNEYFLEAVRHLTFTREGGILRSVDYRNLQSEEMGSIYESLLEMHPELNMLAGTFELRTASGNERKTSGSYYTPDSLVQCLLDSALEPVLKEKIKGKTREEQEQALLTTRTCDPSCGSGHFLIAAAHRIARRLASVRAGDEEPTPEIYRHALRDVISHCVYGVDINPMSVELCKVTLWLEAMEPGRPLSFLDSKIQVGNSLIGTTPELMVEGIPQSAFTVVADDDKDYCAEARSRNKDELKGQLQLFDMIGQAAPYKEVGDFAQSLNEIDMSPDNTVEDIEKKQLRYREFVESEEYLNKRLMADAWCAAFFWIKKPSEDLPLCITEEYFRRIRRNPYDCPSYMKKEINRLAKEYQFFHWHLAFPEVFVSNPSKGFDCILGNPPWEKVKLQEKEFFSEHDQHVANATNASKRKAIIKSLKETNKTLYLFFLNESRKADSISNFLRNSSVYPFCGRGDVNTYSVFSELNCGLVKKTGRVGCIVQTGIATDDTTKFFFQYLVNNNSLVSLYDFENKNRLFSGVHPEQRFCLLTVKGSSIETAEKVSFCFFAHEITDLKDSGKTFTLTSDEIKLMNPNTLNCPVLKKQKDANILRGVYNKLPIIIKEGSEPYNPWGIKFSRFFDMSNDSHLFNSAKDLSLLGFELNLNIFEKENIKFLPLYEGKFTHIDDHRYATFKDCSSDDIVKGNERKTTLDEHKNYNYSILARNWVKLDNVSPLIKGDNEKFLLTFHNIVNVNNTRTFSAAIIPFSAVGNSLTVIINSTGENLETTSALILSANLNSFVFDYFSRLKISSRNANLFIVKQLPIIPEQNYKEFKQFIIEKCFELTFTSNDLIQFAQEYGYNGGPFQWDEERRFQLRCELDAAYFHLYGINRDELIYIMDTFPIVKRKDIEQFGNYRTCERILEIYDEMASTISVDNKSIQLQEIFIPQEERYKRSSANYSKILLYEIFENSRERLDLISLTQCFSMVTCNLKLQDRLPENVASQLLGWTPVQDVDPLLPLLQDMLQKGELVQEDEGLKLNWQVPDFIKDTSWEKCDAIIAIMAYNELKDSLLNLPEISAVTQQVKKFKTIA